MNNITFVIFKKELSMHRIACLLLCLSFFSAQSVFADGEFNVGVALPLTGLAADYGVAYKKGIEMALADSADAATKVKVVYEDHQYDNKMALSAVRKLVSADKVNAVAVWGWNPSEAIAPISEELGLPLLLSSLNPIGRERPMVFNLTGPINTLMEPLAKHVIERGYKSIAYITTSVGALTQSAAEMEELLKHKVKTISNQSVPPDSFDFKSIIAKYKSNPPDVIGLFILPAQIKAFVEQSRALKFKAPLIGENTFNDQMVSQLYVDSSESAPVFVDWYAAPDFLKRLRADNFPASHDVEAAQGYFLGQLLLKLRSEISEPFAPSAVMSALRKLPPGNSPAGTYQVKHSHDFGLHLEFPAVLERLGEKKP